MKKNLGSIDRSIRLIIAVVLVSLYLSGVVTGTWAVAGLGVAAIMVLTSLMNYCPIYGLLGVNTGPKTNTTQVKGNG